MTNAARLGFIGLGSMGSAMAARLLDAGYAVAVFDTNAAALQPLASNGAVVANDVAAVASEADIILGSLPTPDVVREVAIGPGGIIKGGKARLFIDLSTTGPRVSGEVAAALAKANITLVDAPVSGGPSARWVATFHSVRVSSEFAEASVCPSRLNATS